MAKRADLYTRIDRLPNGHVRVTASTKPLRFLDGQGRVVALDPAWTLRNGLYQSGALPFGVSVLSDAVGFSYRDARGTTTYRLRGATRRAPVADGRTVTFPRAFPQTDVALVLSRTGVRAIKTLRTGAAPKAFLWDVEATGEPIRTRPAMGRDAADARRESQRRDLDLQTVESPPVLSNGVWRWTLTETWTGRVKTFTKPDRIPAWTTDPVYPVTMDPTVGPLTSESDDGEELQGSAWTDRYYFWQAGRSGANIFDGGVRFDNVAVPQGATITSAELDFEVITVYGGSVSLTIAGDDVDDAAAWSDTSKPSSGFTATTATTAWTPAFGSEGQQQKDITAIVQEIVNRAGWVSGNAMRFAILNAAGAGSHFVQVDASDAAGNETTLTVVYAAAGGGGVRPLFMV